jgi:hypothetical protein
MDHPNLLRAWPLGEENRRLLVAVNRSTDPSVTDLLRSGPLEPVVCARVVAGAAAGADALTRRGLVARDVTPDAVFVNPEHGGVLADLGIPPELFVQAPLEQDPALLFRSPEELRGDRLDPRSTVYSLGVLLFTALTRARPYEGPWSDVHAALVAGTAPPASQGWAELPPRMDGVIARALAPDREQRCADAAELVRVVAAEFGADVAPKTAPVDSGADEPRARPSSNRVPEPSKAKPRRTTRPAREKPSAQTPRPERGTPRPARAPAQEGAKRPPPGAAAKVSPEQHRGQARPAAQRAKPDSKPRRLDVLRGRFSGAAAGLVLVVGAIARLLRAAGSRVLAVMRRFGAALLPGLRNAAGVASGVVRRAGSGSAALLAGARRRIAAAGRGRPRLRSGLAPAVAGATAARRACTTRLSSLTRKARGGRPASARSVHPRRGFVLAAVGALVVSALTGVALGSAGEADENPPSVTRSGLTIQLPPGWERVRLDPGQPAAFRGLAVGPPGEWGSGLVAGKLSSQAAAHRMLAGAQASAGRRTQVRLGEGGAWRYTGLQPRRGLTGTGYMIPTAGGAVVVICHAPKDVGAFFDKCDRAASTVVASGDRVLPLSSVDRSTERLTEVIDTLRSSRADGLRRLAAADLARGQAAAAASLDRSHRRAAHSIDRIAPLADGQSLAQLSAALRASADGYGRLAAAARTRSGSTYRAASRAVVRQEQALRRELAEVTGA